MGPAALDLSGAEDELYAASPEEFIARRKDLVAQARAAKDRPLATQIGQLRRPTRSAWLLNLLARAEPEQVEELLAIGEALADAQRRRSGDDLRRLSKDRRTAIDAATRRAVAAGAEHGHTAADATVTEVTQTLTAALAEPEVAEDLRRGRLSQAASYGGFGPDALGDALAAMSAGPDTAEAKAGAGATNDEPPAEPPAEPPTEPTAEERAVAEREAALAERREAADAAREAATTAETAADEATTSADELADRVEQLNAELAEATTAAETAQAEARRRRKEAAELRKAAAAAEQALSDASSDA